MLYFFRLLLLLINIDQETVLNWFGIENSINQEFTSFETSTDLSLNTFHLIMEGLWEKVQDGLTLGDIENILFFILFIRFVILAIRYNLKTSVYITCIGLFAGYLWYKHLIDLITMYRSILVKLPFLHKLGRDAIDMRTINRQMRVGINSFRAEENVQWYNPGKILYYAITKAVVSVDSETGIRYYIDPISMIISKLPESIQVNILPVYYKLYNKIIPKIYSILSKFSNQLSGVAGYALITRIGKRYCPYLIRWHWTFLLIIGMVEQLFIYFIYRVYYFQAFIVVPQAKMKDPDPTILLQSNFLNGIITCVVLTHVGLIIFGLFHAIWGQYFYIPFFVENTELHIGSRPTDSVYSGGNTSWQNKEEKEKSLHRLVPKIWYGWFGRGNKNDLQLITNIRKFLKKMIKKLRRQFQR